MSMFSTPAKRNDGFEPSEHGSRASGALTVIARGVRVEGEFVSPGDVQIDGEMHGHVSSSGMLTIGPEAKLKADVTAEHAVIAGTIEGNLTVKQKLELKSTARLMGDLSCETISVEVGAVINGKVTIGAGSKMESGKTGKSQKMEATASTVPAAA